MWKGIDGSCILLHPVAALSGGLSRRGHGSNKSSAPNRPDGIESLAFDIV